MTKQGKHGTLYLYDVGYKCALDSGSPDFDTKVWAYNKEHAVMKFNDSEDTDWHILSVARTKGTEK